MENGVWRVGSVRSCLGSARRWLAKLSEIQSSGGVNPNFAFPERDLGRGKTPNVAQLLQQLARATACSARQFRWRIRTMDCPHSTFEEKSKIVFRWQMMFRMHQRIPRDFMIYNGKTCGIRPLDTCRQAVDAAATQLAENADCICIMPLIPRNLNQPRKYNLVICLYQVEDVWNQPH